MVLPPKEHDIGRQASSTATRTTTILEASAEPIDTSEYVVVSYGEPSTALTAAGLAV
jgi:hypothetical protein